MSVHVFAQPIRRPGAGGVPVAYARRTALALCCAALLLPARAQNPPPVADTPPAADSAPASVEIKARKTRSAVALSHDAIEAILPGTNVLKALHALPGVSFQTADPWGNNEQNLSLFIHGFSGQQLGYTLDGVPLGDQQYGNYNGLSPQRAIISENVASVLLSSGAGDLATASTSNLGGTIETFSSDPRAQASTRVAHTLGSHATARTYARYDSGTFGDDNALYVALLRQRAHAWDFNATQGGNQANAKFTHHSANARLSVYLHYSDKTEPNEDSTVHVAGETSAPYTRPFLYPDFDAALAYLSPTGATPAAAGANYRNYFGVAQRTDLLGYARYEMDLGQGSSWYAQLYFHEDDGMGAVAGPIAVAGLPALFNVYFPGQDLRQVFGGSGYAVRTTEYWIGRAGLLGAWRAQYGSHKVELGGWVEHNRSSAYRRWYALQRQDPLTPYQRPHDPRITQYGSDIDNKVVQLHLQDEWCATPALCLQGGFKSSLQFADGQFPVQPALGVIAGGSTALPVGEIVTKKWFLPQAGLVFDGGAGDQLFVNLQRNMRQFVTYGAVGPSPWSLSSQSAFDLFRATARPETSDTYEAGWRWRRTLGAGLLRAIDGQLSVYHVNFRDRLLQISPTPVISSIVNGNPILANVGGVRTDGIDLAATLHGGSGFSFYNALSYNRSRYGDDYVSGKSVVATNGKSVPGSPTWLDKFVLAATFGRCEAQLTGDYVGKRYATYTNDLSVPGYFLLGMGLNWKLAPAGWLKRPRLSVNVTNLNQEKGTSTLVVGAASGTYNTFPIAPRMVFVTLGADF